MSEITDIGVINKMSVSEIEAQIVKTIKVWAVKCEEFRQMNQSAVRACQMGTHGEVYSMRAAEAAAKLSMVSNEFNLYRLARRLVEIDLESEG